MEKYKINRKLITLTCDCCGKEFQKPISEYKRNLALGRSNYCSRSCSGKSCNKNGKQKGNYESIKDYTYNRLDEFTPFRYYLRNVRKRFKECTITLQDLKDQWEKQQGICPYSGINLVLQTYKNHSNDIIFSASLDRIDSSKGYIPGNIQFVSTAINYMKSTMSDERTKFLCHKIAEHFYSEWTISSSQNEMSDAQAGN